MNNLILCVNTEYLDVKANATGTKKDKVPKMGWIGNVLYIVYVSMHNRIRKISERILHTIVLRIEKIVITQMRSNTLLQK